MKVELVDDEVFAGGDGVAIGSVHAGFEVVEVDGGHGLVDVKIARGSIEAHTIPVEDAVGGVGVLLDFVDEEAGADGVESARGDEDGVARAGLDGVDLAFDGTILKGGFEGLARGAFFETNVEFCTGVAVGDIPHFGFGIAAELGGDFLWRVNLNGEVVAGVEDFDEEGEALAGEAFAEDLFAVI